LAMPGGWRLIGRTTTALFDPDASPPGLLSPGDLVRFDPVREEELSPSAPSARARPIGGRRVFRTASPGLFATIQGAPRYGLASSGVPPGGAMDRSSLARANALVGNGPGEPAVEMALTGPELEALQEVDVAVAGADFRAELDGRPVPRGDAFRV